MVHAISSRLIRSATHVSVLVDIAVVGQLDAIERDRALHQLTGAERSVRMTVRPQLQRVEPGLRLRSVDRRPV